MAQPVKKSSDKMNISRCKSLFKSRGIEILIFISGTLLLMSCFEKKEGSLIKRYKERQHSFSYLKSGYDVTSSWHRKPDNILMLHETFKKIGYQNLMSEKEWNDEAIWYLDKRKSPADLVDSLILTFDNPKISNPYYREFWGRRKSEGNSEIVARVLVEIQGIMERTFKGKVDDNLVNDTLRTLLSYEYPDRKLSDMEANNLLEYLIKIGMHGSAYNLISEENYRFRDVRWLSSEKDLLDSLVEVDTFYLTWFIDDTK